MRSLNGSATVSNPRLRIDFFRAVLQASRSVRDLPFNLRRQFYGATRGKESCSHQIVFKIWIHVEGSINLLERFGGSPQLIQTSTNLKDCCGLRSAMPARLTK